MADTITDKIATIGENMSLRRMARVEGDGVVSYVHNAAGDGMGKIGVLVAYSGDEAFARQVAMHIAATNPASLDEASLDPSVVEKEKQVQIEIARESGKPDAVIEKMIVGRMKKFMSESHAAGPVLRDEPRPYRRGRRQGGRDHHHRFRASRSGRRHREEGRGFRSRGGQGRTGLSHDARSG